MLKIQNLDSWMLIKAEQSCRTLSVVCLHDSHIFELVLFEWKQGKTREIALGSKWQMKMFCFIKKRAVNLLFHHVWLSLFTFFVASSILCLAKKTRGTEKFNMKKKTISRLKKKRKHNGKVNFPRIGLDWRSSLNETTKVH